MTKQVKGYSSIKNLLKKGDQHPTLTSVGNVSPDADHPYDFSDDRLIAAMPVTSTVTTSVMSVSTVLNDAGT